MWWILVCRGAVLVVGPYNANIYIGSLQIYIVLSTYQKLFVFLSKPNPNSNSIQLGWMLDFVFPLSQQEQEQQEIEPSPQSGVYIIPSNLISFRDIFSLILGKLYIFRGGSIITKHF